MPLLLDLPDTPDTNTDAPDIVDDDAARIDEDRTEPDDNLPADDDNNPDDNNPPEPFQQGELLIYITPDGDVITESPRDRQINDALMLVGSQKDKNPAYDDVDLAHLELKCTPVKPIRLSYKATQEGDFMVKSEMTATTPIGKTYKIKVHSIPETYSKMEKDIVEQAKRNILGAIEKESTTAWRNQYTLEGLLDDRNSTTTYSTTNNTTSSSLSSINCISDTGFGYETSYSSRKFCWPKISTLDDFYQTTCADNNWYKIYYTTNSSDWRIISDEQPAPGEKLRRIIAERQSPCILTNPIRKHLATPVGDAEKRARETLRRIIGEIKYRNYLRNGFVTIRAKSGKVYQIFPSHGVTTVFENGQVIDRLCVVLTGGFAPTDSLIMRYLLILNDEDDFRSRSIAHSVRNPNAVSASPIGPDRRPLVEIFAELKQRNRPTHKQAVAA